MPMPEQLESDEALQRVIGEAARIARHALGLSPEQVAQAVGITADYYARIERGVSMPSLQTLIRVARALQVSVARLLGLEDMQGPILAAPEIPDPIAYIIRRAQADEKLYKAVIAVLNVFETP